MTVLKYAVQTGLLPGVTLDEKFTRAAALGYDGVELAGVGFETDFDVLQREAAAASAKSGLPVASICSGGGMDPLVEDAEQSAARFVRLTEVMALAEALGTTGFVSVPHRPSRGFGSRQEKLDWVSELTERAVQGYGEWASQQPAGTSQVFLEPLNRYEASFLNRVEQAVAIAQRINHPRVSALADLFHMNIEEANLVTPITEAGTTLGHVHIADNNRLEPGAGCLNVGPSLAALREIGYQGYVALECGLSVDPADTGAAERVLGSALAHLRSC